MILIEKNPTADWHLLQRGGVTTPHASFYLVQYITKILLRVFKKKKDLKCTTDTVYI